MLFISFTSVIAFSVSSMMLGRGGKIGYPCLVSDPGGKAFSFSPLSVMRAADFSDAFYQVKELAEFLIFFYFFLS